MNEKDEQKVLKTEEKIMNEKDEQKVLKPDKESQKLLKIMNDKAEEFKKENGRNLTYSEMRQLFG